MTKENAKKLYKFYLEGGEVDGKMKLPQPKRAEDLAKARPHVLEEVPEVQEEKVKKGKR